MHLAEKYVSQNIGFISYCPTAVKSGSYTSQDGLMVGRMVGWMDGRMAGWLDGYGDNNTTQSSWSWKLGLSLAKSIFFRNFSFC